MNIFILILAVCEKLNVLTFKIISAVTVPKFATCQPMSVKENSVSERTSSYFEIDNLPEIA